MKNVSSKVQVEA